MALGTGTKTDPFLLSTEQDLTLLSLNRDAHFKLANDITMTSVLSRVFVSGDFRGVLDGDGYAIRDIDFYSTSSSSSNNGGLFERLYGTVKNIELHFDRNQMYMSSSSGNSTSLVALTLYGTISNVHATIKGQWSAYRNYGLANAVNGSTVENCFVEANRWVTGTWSSTHINEVYGAVLVGCSLSISNVTIRNNILHLSSTYTSHSRSDVYTPIVGYNNGTTITGSGNIIEGNVVYAPSPAKLGQNSGQTYATNNLSQFQDPNYIGYNTFDKIHTWHFAEGKNPQITFIGTSSRFPIELSEESHLDYIRNNPSFYFKFTDNIAISKNITSSYLFDIDFDGELDGDGYSLKGINMPSMNGNRAVFNRVTGTIRNIGFEIESIVSYNGNAGGVCYSLSGGTLDKVSVIVSGDIRSSTGSGRHVGGLSVSLSDNSTVTNCYIDGRFYNSSSISASSVMIIGSGEAKDITVKNNIARVSYLYGGQYKVFIGDFFANRTTTGDISDNVYLYSSGSLTVPSGVTSATRISNATQFRDGNNTAYNNFDKNNIWLFQAGQDPMLKIFQKIVQKIEERLIKSYSNTINIFTNKFKSSLKDIISFTNKIKSTKLIGRLQNILSFSKPIKSKTSKFKGSLQNVLSFSKKYLNNISSKKKSNKTSYNFSKKIKTSTLYDLIRRSFRDVKSFSKESLFKSYRINKGTKTSKTFSKSFVVRIRNIKNAIRNPKTFTKSIFSNSYLYVIRKYLMTVKSFSNKFTNYSFSSFLTRAYRTIKSYARPMRGMIRRFSNIYKFHKEVVNSHANAIVSNVRRKVFAKVLSYSKRFFNLPKMLYKITQIANVLAIVSHKFSKIRLFKRENKTNLNLKEHKTEINQEDDGGGG